MRSEKGDFSGFGFWASSLCCNSICLQIFTSMQIDSGHNTVSSPESIIVVLSWSFRAKNSPGAMEQVLTFCNMYSVKFFPL